MEALQQFFGGYFHQDFLVDYGSWQGAVAQFRNDASADELSRVVTELDALIASVGDASLGEELLHLGCYALPPSGEFSEWLGELRAELAAA